MSKRVFVIVLDSLGVGAMPDANLYGDTGSNTLAALRSSALFNVPCLASLGLFSIDGIAPLSLPLDAAGSYGRLAAMSPGKDTTTGHWELAGIVLDKPFPLFPSGFPKAVTEQLQRVSGRGVLCNKPYSGTKVLADYGQQHIETGAVIAYTSADSVLQIAAHEDIIPLEELYRVCEAARDIMQGDFAVGRVIARPFTGEYPNFTRTKNRRDYSLLPDATMLDYIKDAGLDVIGIGKISDIFAGRGLTRSITTKNNAEGMHATLELVREDFSGLCFVNLVDFDMLYGHRNDVDGYAQAMSDFDSDLKCLLPLLRDDDILLITADHGCDPSTPSTDHSREYVPLLVYGSSVQSGVNLGTRESFADAAATVQEYLGLPVKTSGRSFWERIVVI